MQVSIFCKIISGYLWDCIFDSYFYRTSCPVWLATISGYYREYSLLAYGWCTRNILPTAKPVSTYIRVFLPFKIFQLKYQLNISHMLLHPLSPSTIFKAFHQREHKASHIKSFVHGHPPASRKYFLIYRMNFD